MLSKSTINHILEIISYLVKNTIAKEISEAKMFSLQIDTTQDITSKVQCSIIVRYVFNDSIYERLLSMVQCRDSTDKGFRELVDITLKSCNIHIKQCVGTTTDGAANMQGEYNGFTAWMSSESPLMTNVWCYSHVLNLVIIDTMSSTISCESLFGLFNKTAAFIPDSYNRMDTWVSALSSSDDRRLNLIGSFYYCSCHYT